MNSSFITNKGKRKSNQDVVLIKSIGLDKDIFLLADGMGGYKNGEYAANFIVNHLYKILKIQNSFDKSSIQSAIEELTMAMATENKNQDSNMGATLGGVIRSNEVFHCFMVGDVKIFHIRNKKIIYESIEHNLKNELVQNKVFLNSRMANKYKHVVTRSIHGDIKKAQIDYKVIDDFRPGDILTIASDGANEVLDQNYLKNNLFLDECIELIIHGFDEKLKKEAKDNSSVIFIYF